MPSFAYQARDHSGRAHSGVREAESSALLADELRGRGWIILGLEARAAARPRAAGSELPSRSIRWLSRPVRERDVETGLRQVALMLRSGLTLLSSLRAASRHANKPRAGALFGQLADRIESGSTFTDALALFPNHFPPLLVELARAGEHSGTLESALERGADHLQRARELRRAVVQALFYPVIVLALTAAVTGFMVLKVVPVVESFLRASHKKLPAATEALLWVSHAARAHLPTIAIGVAAAGIALFLLDRQPRTRAAMDRGILRLPFVGHVQRLATTTLFARSLATLTGAGIGLVRALELTAGLLRRPTARAAILDAKQRILQGRTLSEGLAGSPAFAPVLVHMVAVGERSGALERVLDDAVVYHESELRAWIRSASALVEPVITVVVGAIVGFVYVAFFLAMFSLAGSNP